MKPRLPNLHEVAAASFLGAGVISGAAALNAHNDAVGHKAVAAVFEEQGDPQANKIQMYAEVREGDRNNMLLLVAASGIAGGAAMTARRKRRQEPGVSAQMPQES